MNFAACRGMVPKISANIHRQNTNKFLQQNFWFFFLVFLVILIKAGVKPKTLSVQHHRFLPQLFCSCLTRLKLVVCHTNNVVQFDSSLAQHFLIGTQHSSLPHLLNVGIALTGNHAQPPRHPKAFASFSLPRVGLL